MPHTTAHAGHCLYHYSAVVGHTLQYMPGTIYHYGCSVPHYSSAGHCVYHYGCSVPHTTAHAGYCVNHYSDVVCHTLQHMPGTVYITTVLWCVTHYCTCRALYISLRCCSVPHTTAHAGQCIYHYGTVSREMLCHTLQHTGSTHYSTHAARTIQHTGFTRNSTQVAHTTAHITAQLHALQHTGCTQ